jgi:hypothetical protein
LTKAEEEFQSRVRDLGCIACLKSNGMRTDCDIHHILSGGKRKGEMFVLGLCYSHHRSELNNAQVVSRHHWRTAFEKRYGSEASMLALTHELLGQSNG